MPDTASRPASSTARARGGGGIAVGVAERGLEAGPGGVGVAADLLLEVRRPVRARRGAGVGDAGVAPADRDQRGVDVAAAAHQQGRVAAGARVAVATAAATAARAARPARRRGAKKPAWRRHQEPSHRMQGNLMPTPSPRPSSG
ncbi:MAG: hypothetical protein H6708_24670 [Kofleriaceae bacterium]|nr:hypothetical protein [Kofleriaceae bacterium]